MTGRSTARTRTRRTRALVGVVALAALASAAAVVGTPDGLVAGHAGAPVPADGRQHDRSDLPALRGPASALGEADGAVPHGVTVFDDRVPAVTRLDPALLGALRRAATDAARQHVEVQVNSGWRSAAYQEQLLRDAVARYGSREQAARWVATPQTSAHVSGDAVDVGPPAAARWLSAHGARYGLCQTYRNEAWHYELRPDAPVRGCPAAYADPTSDPRTQR